MTHRIAAALISLLVFTDAAAGGPSSGAHNLEAILVGLPQSAFAIIDGDRFSCGAACRRQLIAKGRVSERGLVVRGRDDSHGFFAFEAGGKGAGQRIEMKILVGPGARELVFWIQTEWRDPRRVSRMTVFEWIDGAYADVTAKVWPGVALTDFYPRLRRGAIEITLRAAEARPRIWARIATGIDAELHEALLAAEGTPEIWLDWSGGGFAKGSKKLSQIGRYLLQVPDRAVGWLGRHVGHHAEASRLDVVSRLDFLEGRIFKTVARDPRNGYLELRSIGDGGGARFAMVYWRREDGSHLVAVMRTSWGLCCESSDLSFYLPKPGGWREVTDDVIPSLRLGDLPWLRGGEKLSAVEREVSAFSIQLPRKGKDIRLRLDAGTCEDELSPAGLAGIGAKANFEERVLKWRGDRFVW